MKKRIALLLTLAALACLLAVPAAAADYPTGSFTGHSTRFFLGGDGTTWDFDFTVAENGDLTFHVHDQTFTASNPEKPNVGTITYDLGGDDTYYIDLLIFGDIGYSGVFVCLPDFIFNGDADRPSDSYAESSSTLSQGTLAIVTAIAGVAVGLAGGYLLFGRKKKTGEG